VEKRNDDAKKKVHVFIAQVINKAEDIMIAGNTIFPQALS
jgi:hypothetical protein